MTRGSLFASSLAEFTISFLAVALLSLRGQGTRGRGFRLRRSKRACVRTSRVMFAFFCFSPEAEEAKELYFVGCLSIPSWSSSLSRWRVAWWGRRQARLSVGIDLIVHSPCGRSWFLGHSSFPPRLRRSEEVFEDVVSQHPPFLFIFSSRIIYFVAHECTWLLVLLIFRLSLGGVERVGWACRRADRVMK